MYRKFCWWLPGLVLLASCANVKVEERGIWLDKSDMFKPKDQVAKLFDDLQAANFTTVYVNTQFKGGVAYPGSAFLPLAEQAKSFEGDALAWCIEELHRRKMRAEAWVEYGFYSYHTLDATKDKSQGAVLDMHPEWCALDEEGNRYIHIPNGGTSSPSAPPSPGRRTS